MAGNTERPLMEMTTEDLFALADAIGERVKSGKLPPQDKNGFYILPGDKR